MKTGVERYAGGFIFRPARIEEADEIVVLEKSVWGDNAANSAQIKSRIEIFSVGNYVAEYEGRVVAFCSYEYVDDSVFSGGFTWEDITDHGFIIKSHKPSGRYGYGINLSVHHSMNGKRLGDRMSLFGLINIIDTGRSGSFIGSRIPGFASYKKNNPSVRVEDYVSLKRNGKLRDYELRLYGNVGFKPIKVLPNYFPDPESLDYGVLVHRGNVFKYFPLRRLIGRIVWFLVNRMIDKEIKKSVKK